MNNTALAGLILGAVVVAGAGAVAVHGGFNPLQKYAKVVAVEPAFETNQIPREVCGDQTTLEQAPVKDEKRIAGAAAGGYAGSKIQKRVQQGNVEETTEEQCVVVYDTESVQAGYDVTYELDGVQKVVRMDRDPGERIPVENGALVLSQR